MGRLLKIILSIFAAIILLIIIAVVALPFFINPNDFKPEIQAAVKDSIGRELLIDGNLELSIFPWIGVSTGKLALSNATGFSNQPFAEITESNIKVKLLPLFSKKVEVSRIVLKGLTLNLEKNKQGMSNWDDLAKNKAGSKTDSTETPDNTSTSASASPLAALAIGGIAIEQAKIIWDDQQQGKHTEIDDINFVMGRLAFGQAIDIELSFKVINSKPALTEVLKLSTQLIINESLDNIKLSHINIQSETQGENIPGGSLNTTLLAELTVDLVQQSLNITDLKLNLDELTLLANINGTNIKDNPVFKGNINIAEFNLADLMRSMAMPLPKMQASDALNKLSLSLNILATPDSVEIQNLLINLDQSKISGTTKIQNFAKPAIRFNIKIDHIDVDRYLAPKTEKEKNKKTVATPASAAVAGASLFPIKTLRELNIDGLISIDTLKANQLKMKGLSLKLEAKNGLIKTKQTINQLYQGRYSGNSTINVKNKTPTLSLNENLSHVNIEPLLKDMLGEARMSGLVNASAKIQGRGNTTKAIKSGLKGQVNFNFKDGVVRGFNIQKIIDNGKALIKGSPLPTDNKNDQTVFSIIKGTAKITNGLVSNEDLYMEASKLRVNGKGTANLASNKLNYKIKAKLIKKFATDTQPEKLKGLPIIINIGGTIAKPSYQLDITEMLLSKNRAKIEKKVDKLLEKLDDKVGPGVGNLLKSLF